MKLRSEGTQHEYSRQLEELRRQLGHAKDGLNQSQGKAVEVAREAKESKELVRHLQAELEAARASKGRLQDELEMVQRDRVQASQHSETLGQATRRQDQRIQELQAQLQRAKQEEQEFMRLVAQTEARASATQATIASLEHQPPNFVPRMPSSRPSSRCVHRRGAGRVGR